MSTDAANAVAEATAEAEKTETKKKRKSSGPRGPRSAYVFGRSVVLDEFDAIPDDGIAAGSVAEDWKLFSHKMLRHSDYKDPLDYYRWVKDVLVPQIVERAEGQITELEAMGSSAERQDMLEIGSSVDDTVDLVLAKMEANAGSPESNDRIEAKLKAALAKIAAKRAAIAETED